MKIVLGIPTANNPSPHFINSLGALHLPECATSLERVVVNGNFAPGQRELIVRKAAETRADVLVMIDDDMVLPPHTLDCLIETLQAESRLAIAGALYYSRDGTVPMAITNWSSSNVVASSIPAFSDDGPVQVDGVGFGCVAIRMTALEDLDLPIFGTQVVIEPDENRVRVCNEDYLLCERLRGAGWRIAMDGRVRAGHHDRASDTVFPLAWEENGATGHERVLVRNGDGSIELVPFNGSLQCISEEYHVGTLQYVIR